MCGGDSSQHAVSLHHVTVVTCLRCMYKSLMRHHLGSRSCLAYLLALSASQVRDIMSQAMAMLKVLDLHAKYALSCVFAWSSML